MAQDDADALRILGRGDTIAEHEHVEQGSHRHARARGDPAVDA